MALPIPLLPPISISDNLNNLLVTTIRKITEVNQTYRNEENDKLCIISTITYLSQVRRNYFLVANFGHWTTVISHLLKQMMIFLGS